MAAIPPQDEERQFPAGSPRSEGDDWARWAMPAVPFADHSLIVPSRGWHPNDAPFVYQHRDKLLLLVGNAQGWLLAELRFDRQSCSYVESRRSEFAWPREALTALLSRIVTGTERDAEVLGQVSDDFHAWASEQLAVAHRFGPDLCPLCGK